MNPVNLPSNPKTENRNEPVGVSAERGSDRSRGAASPAMDALVDDLSQARADVGPALTEVVGRVEHLARDSAHRAGEQARELRDDSAEYVRSRPLQSLLMAACVGAGIAITLRLLGRAGRRAG